MRISFPAADRFARQTCFNFVARLLPILFFAGDALAESQLVLPYPVDFGAIPVHTYDDQGNPIGDARVELSVLDDGILQLIVESSITGGAHNRFGADLEVISEGQTVRLIRQHSQSFDPSGEPLDRLEIDHRGGQASCTKPGDPPSKATVLPLPDDDRVANVPMNVLFLPLIRGEVKQIKFQVFLCSGGARFMNFVALRNGKTRSENGREIIEVRYGPDLGRLLSWAASKVAPKLSFWFDLGKGSYVAHRAPLYTKGPEVTVVRDGIPAKQISR
jgi:hypothetical protein